jgi:hypothetical protein
MHSLTESKYKTPPIEDIAYAVRDIYSRSPRLIHESKLVEAEHALITFMNGYKNHFQDIKECIVEYLLPEYAGEAKMMTSLAYLKKGIRPIARARIPNKGDKQTAVLIDTNPSGLREVLRLCVEAAFNTKQQSLQLRELDKKMVMDERKKSMLGDVDDYDAIPYELGDDAYHMYMDVFSNNNKNETTMHLPVPMNSRIFYKHSKYLADLDLVFQDFITIRLIRSMLIGRYTHTIMYEDILDNLSPMGKEFYADLKDRDFSLKPVHATDQKTFSYMNLTMVSIPVEFLEKKVISSVHEMLRLGLACKILKVQ